MVTSRVQLFRRQQPVPALFELFTLTWLPRVEKRWRYLVGNECTEATHAQLFPPSGVNTKFTRGGRILQSASSFIPAAKSNGGFLLAGAMV